MSITVIASLRQRQIFGYSGYINVIEDAGDVKRAPPIMSYVDFGSAAKEVFDVTQMDK